MTVELDVSGEDLVLAVSDRGPGVPEDRLQRIFERFTKLDPSRTGGSSGLGLAIAAEHAAPARRVPAGHEPRRGRPPPRARSAGACDPFVTRRRWLRDPGVREWDSNDHHEGVRAMIRTGHHILAILALSVIAIAVVACGPTGSLGTVPPVSRTPTPSVDPGPPDMTPEPSADPSVDPSPSAPPSQSPGSPTATPKPTPTPAPADTMVIRAYFVLDGDVGVEGLVPTLREVPETTAVARAAMDALLRGEILADYDDLASAIPAGTRLLGLSIRDGIATVDLSREFESGGGSASAFYRLGQVTYTLTQFPTVRAVLFQVEGQTVTTFGSEGIVLEGPAGSRRLRRPPALDLRGPAGVRRCGSATPPGSPATPTCSRRASGSRSSMGPARRSWTSTRWPRAAPAAAERSTSPCATRSRGRSGGRCGCTTARPRTDRPQDVRDYPVWLTPAR